MGPGRLPTPQIHFAQARGARLAYQEFGDPDNDVIVVAIPPLAQNIEHASERHEIRRMFDRFAEFCRYVHFDKRGTGASDHRSEVPGIDERVEDVRAVMDAAGIEQAHLFVQSDGGPMAILFAVTYPHRVRSLILLGSGAIVQHRRPEEERIAMRDRFVAEWGTPDSRLLSFFAPSIAGDADFRAWHERYERTAATRGSLSALLDLSFEMDVREVLAAVDVPTLVMHRTGDMIIPIEWGRELAAGIPGATLIEYDSNDHFAFVGDMGWVDDVERFITGSVTDRKPAPSADMKPRITTLGRFAVSVDLVEVPTSEWGSRLARQLCKRLVAARGWPLTREQLIDMLWPDETDMRRLSARLSVQLSTVRRILGGGVIADRDSVRLDLDEVSTDLDDFYRADDDAAIVASYGGEFLPEDRYEEWADAPRQEARGRFIAAAHRQAATYAAEGIPSRVAHSARSILDADPYDERAHRMLVTALTDAGDTGAARAAHANWQRLMSELDVAVPPLDDVLTG